MEGNGRGSNLARRQQCACLIQEIGSRLPTTQVVINASLYYMHHFYEIFSPETIKPVMVALASLYIACKTEDFSRKLALLISVAYAAFKKPMPPENSSTYKRIVQNIHSLEATMLMVIGFQKLDVKQPHVILITVLRDNKFPKDISHTSYYVCTHILHFTTLVLRHSMEAIAATSLYIAAKWNNFDIQCGDGEWYLQFSPKLTLEEIRSMTDEFTQAFQACDMKIKEHVKNLLKSRRIPREDPMARRFTEPPRVFNRGEKRPYESHNSMNSQQLSAIKGRMPLSGSCGSVGSAYRESGLQSVSKNSGTYGDYHLDAKIPRVHSPQSQPPPQISSQPSFQNIPHPESASSYKRDDSRTGVQRNPGNSVPRQPMPSTTRPSSTQKNDLSSVF
uniref:Cyclin N-terminal domain-containing protein n=2 Tax=Mesocestoides corti TaxID=53468 RepID=A0A5K3FCF6_MESCO